ncbi:MAG: acyloxyacyl hydrolase [Janthinobacterium lividum]
MRKFEKGLAGAVAFGLLAISAGAQAISQRSPVQAQASARSWEAGVLFQGGKGVTDERDDFRFYMAGVHLGKVLTPEIGKGMFRGNFEYAAELFPYWQSDTPKFQRYSCLPTLNPAVITCSSPYTVGGTFHGVTVTPIILRWNFTAGKRLMPWAQAAGGLLWTNHKYPAYGQGQVNLVNDGPNADASIWNFTPQGGVGIHYFVKPQQSVDLSANGVHISSASLGDRNPGVNASVQFSVGYSWWKTAR